MICEYNNNYISDFSLHYLSVTDAVYLRVPNRKPWLLQYTMNITKCLPLIIHILLLLIIRSLRIKVHYSSINNLPSISSFLVWLDIRFYFIGWMFITYLKGPNYVNRWWSASRFWQIWFWSWLGRWQFFSHFKISKIKSLVSWSIPK